MICIHRFLISSFFLADRLLESINTSLKVIEDPQSKPKSRDPSPNNSKKLLTANGSNRSRSPSPNRPQLQDLPAVPCRKLGLIVPPLLKHLSSVLQSIKNTEDEIKRSRVELLRCKVEAGSCSSIIRDSPSGHGHSVLSAKSSQSDEVG